MIKTIISSKVLANELSRIDFNQNHINRVMTSIMHPDFIILETNTNDLIMIYCEVEKENKEIDQQDRRWDWIYDVCSQIDEQPIVLDITENKVEIKLQY